MAPTYQLVIFGVFCLYVLGLVILSLAIKFKKINAEKYKIKYLLYASLALCIVIIISSLYSGYLYWNIEFDCLLFENILLGPLECYFYIGMSSIVTIFIGLVFWMLRLRRTALLCLVIVGVLSFTSIASINKFGNEWKIRKIEFCSTPKQVKKVQNEQLGFMIGIGMLLMLFKYKEGK